MDQYYDPQPGSQPELQPDNRQLLEMIQEQNHILSDIREQLRAVQSYQVNRSTANEVNVADIKMKFGSMVEFMLKWIFASIPAGIILLVIWFAFMLILTFLGIGFGGILDSF